MSIPLSPHSRMPSATVVLMLTVLMGIQPVTTDLYLPALPTITRAFGASMSSAQLTLAGLMICFGFGQLACGALADRYGRRPVLVWGLALYTAASLLGALAPSIGWLIAWRALQGVGLAAAVTCGRSMIRDLYQPHDGARVMSRALTGLGAIAVVSPVLGGVLTSWWGWRAALLAVAVFGAGALAYVARHFEETVPERNAQATRLGPLLRNWRSIVTHPTFGAFAVLSAATYGGLFAFLAGSSFVFVEVLGVSRAAFGLYLASASFAYMLGTLLCRRLLRTHGLREAVRIGGALSLVGGVAMAGLSLAGVHGVWAILVPQWVYSIGHGIHQPCGQAGAVGPFPEKAGTAASLSGFVMTASAFAVGLWIGRSFDGTVYPLTMTIGAFSIAVAASAWTLVQRHGEVRAAEPLIEPA